MCWDLRNCPSNPFWETTFCPTGVPKECWRLFVPQHLQVSNILVLFCWLNPLLVYQNHILAGQLLSLFGLETKTLKCFKLLYIGVSPRFFQGESPSSPHLFINWLHFFSDTPWKIPCEDLEIPSEIGCRRIIVGNSSTGMFHRNVWFWDLPSGKHTQKKRWKDPPYFAG